MNSQKNHAVHTKTGEENEGPVMFQFEPDYETAVQLQREALKQKIRGLDTLDISDRKRRRMIKVLYKASGKVNLKKSVEVDTKFGKEESED
ncbi:hypothetical protein SAMN05421797_102255 [Maribacter ulvicola]|uniref:Uncharacterized protein n=2 Tax=Maribacter ulvicola TaxID=228959 RepID=A0A1N6U954_9FLAO|nr:hypothetical protein SAMN05421797_102255 [Maribacter ulvicola]